MAFNVNVFGHRGIEQLPVNLPKQFASDATYQLVQPYEWRDALVCDGATIDTSAAQAAGDKTMILRVEVPDGQAIRYEINPPNRAGGAVVPTAASPILQGINHFYFRQGWQISVGDQASLG